VDFSRVNLSFLPVKTTSITTSEDPNSHSRSFGLCLVFRARRKSYANNHYYLQIRNRVWVFAFCVTDLRKSFLALGWRH